MQICVCAYVFWVFVAATKYHHIVYDAKLSQLYLMHLPKTNFIVDLLLTCLFGFVAFCCVAFRIVSICFVFCFMFYVLCVLLGCPPKKGEALQPLLKCSALWPMKMFAPFNYYHHCCIYCRFNYKMRLSECVAIGRGSSLWLLSPLQSPLLSPLLLL